MQVTETLSDGLKRAYRVVVPVAELAERADKRLEELKGRVNVNGFRPGKVPVAHLKKLYGRSVLAECVNEVVSEANNKIFADNQLKTATEPDVKLPEDESAIAAIFDGKADLAYDVSFEVLPAVPEIDLGKLKVTRPVAEVTDAHVNETLDNIAKQNAPFAEKKGKAADGDRLTIDFVGTMNGEKFDGGSAEGIELVLGSGNFIPGFEDQLKGVKAGDDKLVKVTFPLNYMAQELAGKDAEFAVKVSKVEAPGKAEINDELAKMVGLDKLDTLKDNIRSRLTAEFGNVARAQAKRSLLDALDDLVKFDLPATLVDQEFKNIWEQVENDLKTRGKTFKDEDTTEEKARADYRKIAERRVRLGLVLADIGERNAIKVTDEEVTRAVVERARQFPGQEQQVWDFYRKNAQALASLRAPVFEEKVVDFVLEKAKVTEKKMSKDELFKAAEADED